ncbi:MAG: WD40 repeat domain-containing protein [Bacteroidota bacterium]|nr:WD40 repeat domain-containing protein [Bacteroidota bacterium]
MIPIVTKRTELKGHVGAVYSLSQGLSDDMVLSASGDKFVAQWNIETGKPDTFSVKMQAIVYATFYLKEQNKLLVGTAAGSFHVFDLQEKKEVKNLVLDSKGIFAIQYSSLRKKIFLATEGGKLIVLDAKDFLVEKIINVSKLKLRSCCLGAEETILYVTDGTGDLHVFNAQTLERIHSFSANKLSCNIVAVHPSEAWILTGGRDAYLNVYDVKNYQLVKSIPAHNYAIYDIKFLTGTNYFATASRDKTVKLWGAQSLDFLLRINKEQYEGHTHSVNSLFWSQKNNCLVSAGDDRRIILWNIE